VVSSCYHKLRPVSRMFTFLKGLVYSVGPKGKGFRILKPKRALGKGFKEFENFDALYKGFVEIWNQPEYFSHPCKIDDENLPGCPHHTFHHPSVNND
jgi:hypothetical protein